MHIQGLKFFKFQICWNKTVGKTSSSHSYSDLNFVHKPTTATRHKKTPWQKKPPQGVYSNMVSLLFYFQTFQRKGRYVCSLSIHYLRYRTQRGRSAYLAHGSTWRTDSPKPVKGSEWKTSSDLNSGFFSYWPWFRQVGPWFDHDFNSPQNCPPKLWLFCRA